MLLKLLTWTPSPCDTWMGGTLPPTAPAPIPYTNFSSNKPMDTELFQEINDMPAEIFDIPGMQQDDRFDVEAYLNGDTDY